MKTTFRSDTLGYGLAMVAERVLGFFLLPILTKAISPADYAIWTQSVVVTGVLTPVVLMGQQTALVKYFPLWKSTQRRCDSILLTMFAAIFYALLVVTLIAILLSDSVAEFIYGDKGYVHYIPLLAVLLVSEALFEFLLGILRATNRIRRISLYIFGKGIWRVISFLVILYGFGGNLYTAFWAFAVVQILFVLLMYIRDVPVVRVFGSGFAHGREQWGEVLSFSLPLIPLSIMIGLNNFTDRFFLTHLRGLDEVAAYAAAFSLAAIAAFFYSVLGFTLFPVLAESWAKGRKDETAIIMERMLQVYLICLMPFIAGMAVVGQDVIALLSNEACAASKPVFLLLACNVGLFGIYQIAFYVVLLGRGGMPNLGLMAVAAIVNALLNAFLIPWMGMIGAALSGFASNSLLAALTLYLSRHVLLWRFPWKNITKIALRTGVMAGFLWLAIQWVDVASVPVMLAVLLSAVLLYFALDHFDKRASILTLLKLT